VKLLLDTDVVLDVLTERRPHYAASAGVLTYIERGSARGLIAAHAVTTIHYLLARHLTRSKATDAIALLLDLLEVAAVDGKTLKRALSLAWRDFEDAVTAVAAIDAGATHVITRNTKDFKALPLSVLSPAAFVVAVGSKSE